MLRRPQPHRFPVGPHNSVNEILGLLAHLCQAEVELGQSLVIHQPVKQLLPTVLQMGEKGGDTVKGGDPKVKRVAPFPSSPGQLLLLVMGSP